MHGEHRGNNLQWGLTVYSDRLLPELDGTPLGWINKGEYEIAEGYTAPSNIEAVTEKYGAYIPEDYLMDGIIWIMTE